MTRRLRRSGVMLAGIAIVAAASLSAQQALSRQDAESLEKKLATIAARGVSPRPKTAAPLRTSFTERELNSYLKFAAHDTLPVGLVDPQLTLTGHRQFTGRAIVNLDHVRTSKPRTWLDPASYLTGSLELKAAGTLATSAGRATLHFDTASIGGVPIPMSLLQELVSFYSKTPDLPGGFDLDTPFDLPAAIREVEIQRGSATIVQ